MIISNEHQNRTIFSQWKQCGYVIVSHSHSSMNQRIKCITIMSNNNSSKTIYYKCRKQPNCRSTQLINESDESYKSRADAHSLVTSSSSAFLWIEWTIAKHIVRHTESAIVLCCVRVCYALYNNDDEFANVSDGENFHWYLINWPIIAIILLSQICYL